MAFLSIPTDHLKGCPETFWETDLTGLSRIVSQTGPITLEVSDDLLSATFRSAGEGSQLQVDRSGEDWTLYLRDLWSTYPEDTLKCSRYPTRLGGSSVDLICHLGEIEGCGVLWAFHRITGSGHSGVVIDPSETSGSRDVYMKVLRGTGRTGTADLFEKALPADLKVLTSKPATGVPATPEKETQVSIRVTDSASLAAAAMVPAPMTPAPAVPQEGTHVHETIPAPAPQKKAPASKVQKVVEPDPAQPMMDDIVVAVDSAIKAIDGFGDPVVRARSLALVARTLNQKAEELAKSQVQVMSLLQKDMDRRIAEARLGAGEEAVQAYKDKVRAAMEKALGG